MDVRANRSRISSTGQIFRALLIDADRDLRLACRRLRRERGLSALIIGTLAIGIGATATMAGALDRLMFRSPASVRDPDRITRVLVALSNTATGTIFSSSISFPAALDLQRSSASFESTAAYSTLTLSLGIGSAATEVRVSLVSPTFFSVFGAAPALGRFFTQRDGFPQGEAAGGPRLAVLSYGFWSRAFGSDPGVLGRRLQVGALTYNVVGVAPKGFQGVEAEAPDLWLPITVTAAAEAPQLWFGGRMYSWVSAVGRLKRGVSDAAGEQEATAVWRRANASAGDRDTTGRIVLAPMALGRGPDRPRDVNMALWLGGVSVLVLLITCANVGNLSLGRAFARRGETAIRTALGATRARLARQMLAEAIVLASLGSVAALYLAAFGGRLLHGLLVTDFASESFVDARLIVFTAMIALGTSCVVGIVPMIQGGSKNLSDDLRTGSASGGARRSHVRTTLLSVQAALSTVLLIGAMLFVQSLRHVEGLDLGVDVDRTLMVKYDLSHLALPGAAMDALYSEMRSRVAAIGGVERATLAEGNPYRNGRAVAVHTRLHDSDYYVHAWMTEAPMEAAVDSGFFTTVGAASLQGRDFGSMDVRGAPRVAIINEPLAKLLFPTEQPLGQCILLPVRGDDIGGDCVTVVGVLHGYWRRTILNRAKMLVYVPLAQREVSFGRPSAMFVRIHGDPTATVAAVRSAIQSVLVNAPAVSVTWMRDMVDPEVKPWRLAATMFGVFGLVALAVSAIGIYAVVAFSTEQRSIEIAVRLALGAPRRSIVAVVANDGLRAVLIGLTIGTLVALAVQRWIGPLLFQTSPNDPLVIGSVVVLLFATAVAAVVVPTFRALRRGSSAILRSS
jgi:putative ABC transport system permease protein